MSTIAGLALYAMMAVIVAFSAAHKVYNECGVEISMFDKIAVGIAWPVVVPVSAIDGGMPIYCGQWQS